MRRPCCWPGGIGLSACSSDSGTNSALVTVNGSEPQNPRVPTNTNENGGGRIVDRLFAGLKYHDAKGEPHDEMAQSIETSDQKNFTIITNAELAWNGLADFENITK